MRFSVGQYTTARRSFAEDLAIYREAGAEGIGIDLGLKPLDPVEDLARFRDSGLTATFCFAAVNSVSAGLRARGSLDPAERVEAMCAGLRELAPYDPVCCVYGTGPYLDRDREQVWSFTVDAFKRVAHEADELGLKVAIEPLHKTLGEAWSFLTDLPQTIRLLDAIDAPNVGFLFDVWHLWDSPEVHALLEANTDRVLAVHLDDWREPTRSWADRVLPGDGVADIVGFLRILRNAGYDDWLELEIFSDDGFIETAFEDSLWARDPVEMIRDGRERIERLWAQADEPRAN
jgi:sugar phosphate isomerase/epimerase